MPYDDEVDEDIIKIELWGQIDEVDEHVQMQQFMIDDCEWKGEIFELRETAIIDEVEHEHEGIDDVMLLFGAIMIIS